MRVPLEWLAEYTTLPAGSSGVQVAADLVRVGLEEDGLHGGEVTGPLVVGRVLTVDPEPQKNGKVINWCTVDVGRANGTGQPQGIVCGAHNFGPGDLVAVILPGGVLPGNFVISERKTYGHLSAGMICSAKELGLGEDHDGILVLTDYLGPDAAELEPGQDAIGLLGLDHEVIEVNITPDRGYCFSMRGIAREYALSTGAPFEDPAAIDVDQAQGVGYPVRVEDEAPIEGVLGCDRYIARVVRGLDLSRRTPAWLATRLTEAGMRPISLAVDVTNYVMLALGQPLHAFDLDSLGGRAIVVRRAGERERLTTLDDVERDLHPEDLLITAEGGPGEETSQILALAGVMGGQSSEVTPATTDVLIEAAHFDARTVARTARRHRLATEASKRYERGVDPEITDRAAQLAVNLLVELGGGVADPQITDLDQRTEPVPFEAELAQSTRYVGVEYSDERVVEILTAIGCQISPADRPGWVRVRPPSWRPDLTTGPDLVEEVARIDGYEKIPSVLPTPPGGRGLTAAQRGRRVVTATLAGAGLTELVTIPFVGSDRFDALGLDPDDSRRSAVRLTNPLSAEAPFLRTELIQTLVEVARRNVARGAKDVALFEIGTVPAPVRSTRAPVPGVGAVPAPEILAAIRDAVPPQPWHLGIVALGNAERQGWWGPGRPADAADAIAWAASVCELFAVPVRRLAAERAPWHPGRCVELALPGGETVGWAGELHPKVLASLGLPERTVAAELDLDVILRAGDRRVQGRPISTHPAATSDVALTLARTVRAGDVQESLIAGAGELLESVELFDRYTGDQLQEGQQSLAFRMTFRAPERTLTTEEVNRSRDAAVARAAADHAAVQR